MKSKYLPGAAIIVVSFLLFLYSCADGEQFENQTDTPVRHDLTAIQIGNVWKIVQTKDTTQTTVNVARGDTVVWHAPAETDIFSQFNARYQQGKGNRPGVAAL